MSHAVNDNIDDCGSGEGLAQEGKENAAKPREDIEMRDAGADSGQLLSESSGDLPPS